VSLTRLGLKVDVDTYSGLRDGVPTLLDVFHRFGVRASFFIPFGPDHSGKALWRVFRHPGFLAKLRRTRAASTYGLRTILSGTLLPGRPIGPSFPDRLEKMMKEGHGLGLHGHDHVFWHDRLFTLPLKKVQEEFMKGYETFRQTVGRPPQASAAPGWQCSPESLSVQDTLPLLYHSDTRGEEPYFPRVGNTTYRTLEIPTTLPTWDEIWQADELHDNTPERLLSAIKPGRLNVLTLHAEIEGGIQRKAFEVFLEKCLEESIQPIRLEEIARETLSHKDRIPVLGVQSGSLPGRAGVVSCAVK
jgi:peptidoglycan/xylan/chitin deacetylase (PgdA/CDA1 family)